MSLETPNITHVVCLLSLTAAVLHLFLRFFVLLLRPTNQPTEEPTAAVLTNGIRIVVGGSGLDWRGSAMGGTSYTPSFGASNEYYKPSFVFSNDLYNDVR